MRFFIVGTGRCGTTLLWKMMTLHPELFVFRETHWIPKMYEIFGTSKANVASLLDIVDRTTWATGAPTTSLDSKIRQQISQQPGEMSVRAFCDLLGKVFAEQSGKRYFADKTPDYGYCMATLQALWPECRFVHLMRDGAAVVASMAAHPGYRILAASRELSWCPISFNQYHQSIKVADLPWSSFVEVWYRRIVRTRDESKRLSSGSYLEVRYEDLLADSSAVLTQIASFAGLQAPESWLDRTSKLADPGKIRSRRSPAILEAFGEQEMQLLNDLGYGCERAFHERSARGGPE